jgi:hypothetical protein
VRRGLRRIHIWLGWIVGVPLLIWTLTGALMVAVPFDQVRGDDLLAPLGSVTTVASPVVPAPGLRAIKSLTLEQRAGGPRWIIRYADGNTALADPATGQLLPAFGAADAEAEVRARYRGGEAIAGTDRTSANDPPIDLRRPLETWRVTMTDGTRFYVDSGTGEIVVKRTASWRFYDFLYGLHIFDVGARDNINNIWARIFAWIGAVSVVLAIVLLPFTLRRRRRAGKD